MLKLTISLVRITAMDVLVAANHYFNAYVAF